MEISGLSLLDFCLFLGFSSLGVGLSCTWTPIFQKPPLEFRGCFWVPSYLDFSLEVLRLKPWALSTWLVLYHCEILSSWFWIIKTWRTYIPIREEPRTKQGVMLSHVKLSAPSLRWRSASDDSLQCIRMKEHIWQKAYILLIDEQVGVHW